MSVNWNRFDFSLVCCGVLEAVLFIFIVTSHTENVYVRTLQDVLRPMRLLRLLRAVHTIEQLREILYTLLKALPSLGAIVSLMLLAFFIYGLLGVQIFHQVIHGEFINEDVNFESLPRAMLTLLACATGESWNGVMQECDWFRRCGQLQNGDLHGHERDCTKVCS